MSSFAKGYQDHSGISWRRASVDGAVTPRPKGHFSRLPWRHAGPPDSLTLSLLVSDTKVGKKAPVNIDRRCLQCCSSSSSGRPFTALSTHLTQSCNKVGRLRKSLSSPLNPGSLSPFFFYSVAVPTAGRDADPTDSGTFLLEFSGQRAQTLHPSSSERKQQQADKNNVSIKRVGGVEVEMRWGFQSCTGNRKGETGQRRGGRWGPFGGGRGMRWNK